MRWIWIDSFVAFVAGSHASAIKNVSLAEDHLGDHWPGYPVFPSSLMIEGMAQTAGILVGQVRGFRENVILAKIREAEFTQFAGPGDRITYHARIDSIDESAAATSGDIMINDAPSGRVSLLFSYVNEKNAPPGVPVENFVFTDEFMRLFRSIGQDSVEAVANP